MPTPRPFGVALSLFVLSLPLFAPGLRANPPFWLEHFKGAIDLTAADPLPFAMQGQCIPLNNFKSRGEITFSPGGTPGTLIGRGVIVLTTSDGDRLVGEAIWDVGPVNEGRRPVHMHYSWRDAVRLADGTTVTSTGRFANQRPGDMHADGIIAILIGLITPAPR